MKKITTSECVQWLREHDKFLIISHKRPDGDTLGSGAALCSALRRAGKAAFCYKNAESTLNYHEFVDKYDAPEGFRFENVITVDVASEGLFPKGFDERVNLAIDHHPSNSLAPDNLCLYGEKSACGEIILDIIAELCGGLTQEEADLLYIALSTDTGCFQYSNTNADSFLAASRILEYGADNKRLNTIFFRTMSPARMKLEGRIYSGLQFFRGGKIVAATITKALLDECRATEDDCEDLAGLPGKALGSIVSMTIRETDEGESKVSLRSHPEVNSSEICAVYGGGGHAMAAGCTLSMPVEEALSAMLRAIDEKWPQA